MIKTIKKIGNSRGIILDAALLDLARLQEGDQLDLVVHDSGAITLTPIRPVVTPGEGGEKARELISKNSELGSNNRISYPFYKLSVFIICNFGGIHIKRAYRNGFSWGIFYTSQIIV